MKKQSSRYVSYIANAAMIAAIYVALTLFVSAFQLASGAIQIRISEALTILPIFTTAAIPGLTIGCFLANLITGALLPDVIFGSLATLLGAVGTYLLRRKKILPTIPPVLANASIVPLILKYCYGLDFPIAFSIATVAIGEIVSCMVLGGILRKLLLPYRHIFFAPGEESVVR